MNLFTRNTRQTGELAEHHACLFLEKQGYQLVEKNFHCRYGEIDLVMKNDSHLVFIEVRYRKNIQFGTGADTVNYNKQSKLVKSARFYLQQHSKLENYAARFDVISMTGDSDKYEIDWIENAFEAY